MNFGSTIFLDAGAAALVRLMPHFIYAAERHLCGAIARSPPLVSSSMVYLAFARSPVLLLHRSVERALHLEDIVLIEPLDLEYRAWWIGLAAPQLLLNLMNNRSVAVHIGYVHDEAYGIAQCRAFRFGDQLHVQKALADSCLVTLDQRVGFRINS